MTPSELTQAVKRKARELGFDKVGIAPAARLEPEGARLREWLGRGYAGSMGWMERTADKRADPALHLESVRSVVCVAMNYYTPHAHAGAPGTGKVSRYAWGDDYHDVLGERLRDLLAFVREIAPGAEGKIAVDSSPVMDKAWAARAGLGWIGKHSNLITPEMGSWVFLGELLLSVELEYDDEPVANHCGTCTACIDACPTGAIVEPYVVDSTRCISYATIELRDAELPFDTAGWVYGCDVCQDVCPWNRFQRETAEARFEPRPGLVEPGLEELAELSQEAFSAKFKGSPMKRTKLHGITRNARRVASCELRVASEEESEASGLATRTSHLANQSPYRRTFVVTHEEGRERLDRFLEARMPGVSRAALRRAIRDGEVTVDGETWTAGLRVNPGASVAIRMAAEPIASLLPEAIPLAVLFEDDAILVVDKPAGMLAHPTSTVHGGTLANALAHRLGPAANGAHARPGLVHRLDRATSGLMVVAKTPRAHERLARAFRERRVEKRYLALVCGRPAAAEGFVDAPIGHAPDAHPRWGVREPGRPARTRYAVVEPYGPYTLAELEPLTGRTNQLRIHAAHAGWPIAGDPIHGAAEIARFLAGNPGTPAPGRLFLHAHRLTFAHPETGARLEVEAPLPEELGRFLGAFCPNR